MSVAEILFTRASTDLAHALRAIGDLDATLERLVEQGRAACPDVPVDDDAWARHLLRHLAAEDVRAQLDELRPDGVHLALGCLAADTRALAEFDRRLREVAPRALSRIRLDRVSYDELLQDVRERLLVARPGAELPKLASYSGRGPLEGWLRVTIARAAISALRDRGDEAWRDDEQALLDQAASDDPRLEALKSRCAPVLKSAIEEAIAALPDEDRVLLRLHMVDGLTIDDLAAIYRAHRATTARRLARVRHRIFDGARERAMERLGVEESEFASLMGLMLSKLDVTIVRLLRDPGGASKETA